MIFEKRAFRILSRRKANPDVFPRKKHEREKTEEREREREREKDGTRQERSGALAFSSGRTERAGNSGSKQVVE